MKKSDVEYMDFIMDSDCPTILNNRKNMDKSITVKAKDNDVVFRLFQNDTEIDEIHIQIEGEKSWTVIGYKDLQNAILKAEKKFNPKRLKICPQCQRKHNETQFNVFCCAACWNGF